MVSPHQYLLRHPEVLSVPIHISHLSELNRNRKKLSWTQSQAIRRIFNFPYIQKVMSCFLLYLLVSKHYFTTFNTSSSHLGMLRYDHLFASLKVTFFPFHFFLFCFIPQWILKQKGKGNCLFSAFFKQRRLTYLFFFSLGQRNTQKQLQEDSWSKTIVNNTE